MSEEVRRAKQAIPRSMFWTVATNGVLAYSIIVTMLFTMGPLDKAMNANFPIIEICLQATGSPKAATALVCGLLVISLSVNLASIASVSRLTWAWSRDGALPAWFSYVSFRHCSTVSKDTCWANYRSRLIEDIAFLSGQSGSRSSSSASLPASTLPAQLHSAPSSHSPLSVSSPPTSSPSDAC